MRRKSRSTFEPTIVDGSVMFDAPPNLTPGAIEHRPDNVMQIVIRPDSLSGAGAAGIAIADEEWFDVSHPDILLLGVESRMSPRKRRLFATACCRRIANLLPHASVEEALMDSESLADGAPVEERIEERREEFSLRYDEIGERRSRDLPHSNDESAAFGALSNLMYRFLDAGSVAGSSAQALGESLERPIQSRLLRCVVAPPSAGVPDPSWRTSTAVAIAKGMYDSRDFSAMPILADALQDAGCEDAHILDHCHGPGPHVKGCWVVDIVLGKE